jgi:hypothetical protein
MSVDRHRPGKMVVLRERGDFFLLFLSRRFLMGASPFRVRLTV